MLTQKKNKMRFRNTFDENGQRLCDKLFKHLMNQLNSRFFKIFSRFKGSRR